MASVWSSLLPPGTVGNPNTIVVFYDYRIKLYILSAITRSDNLKLNSEVVHSYIREIQVGVEVQQDVKVPDRWGSVLVLSGRHKGRFNLWKENRQISQLLEQRPLKLYLLSFRSVTWIWSWNIHILTNTRCRRSTWTQQSELVRCLIKCFLFVCLVSRVALRRSCRRTQRWGGLRWRFLWSSVSFKHAEWGVFLISALQTALNLHPCVSEEDHR